MKKEVTVCFRASADLRKALEKVAGDGKRSLSSAIKLILTDYLKERRVTDHGQQERRRYARKAVAIPAYVKTGDSSWHGAVVLDLSLGGIRISVPRECVSKIYEGQEESQFETSFEVPGMNETIQVVCKPKRVVPSNEDVQVGASFVDADFGSYQVLQRYLV